jgi:hypothetical protein
MAGAEFDAAQIADLKSRLLATNGEIDQLLAWMSKRSDGFELEEGQRSYLAWVLRNFRERWNTGAEAIHRLEVELVGIYETPVTAGKFSGPTATGLLVRMARGIQNAVKAVLIDESNLAWSLVMDDTEYMRHVKEFEHSFIIEIIAVSQAFKPIEDPFRSDPGEFWTQAHYRLRNSIEFACQYRDVLLPAIRRRLIEILGGYDSHVMGQRIDAEFDMVTLALKGKAAPTHVNHDKLTECQKDCIQTVREAGRRLTTRQMLDALQTAERIHGESTVKTALAYLCKLRLMDSRKNSPRGNGYGLPEWE